MIIIIIIIIKLTNELENEEMFEIDIKEIKKVSKFKYLESVLESNREKYCEIERTIREGRNVIDMIISI